MKLYNRINSAKRPIIAPLAGFPGMRLTGGNLQENLTSAARQFDTVSSLYDRFRPDFVFPMMDLTVECEAAGAKVKMSDEAPAVEGHAVCCAGDLSKLKLPSAGGEGRLHVFIDTVRMIVKNLPTEAVKCGYILGPLSMAGRLMGTTELAVNVALEPEFVHGLLEFCHAFLQEYLSGILASGPDCVWILEPTASLFSPSQAGEFSNAYVRQLMEKIKSAGASPVLHNCGRIGHLMESYSKIGTEGLSVGSCMNLQEVWAQIPPDLVLFGNVDPSGIFLQGTPEMVREETGIILKNMNGKANFILSSGCDLPAGVPLENLAAFVDAAREFPWREGMDKAKLPPSKAAGQGL
ncbi:MAG: uroporphyrinogen decarboxylase family protein [Bacillota bacterium]